MSVVYRDRDRYDDNKSVASGRTSGGTKITRYIVKDDYDDTRSRYDDTRSRYNDRKSEYDYSDRRVDETRILRTSREDESPQRAPSRAYSTREPAATRSRETITIKRDEEPERRREYWREPAGEQVDDRELVVRRTTERTDNNRDRETAISRVEDRYDQRFSDYEVVSPQRHSFDDRDREVQRYIRNTEYYQPPVQQPPQTIIIRQEPIIIRERGHDHDRSRSRSRDRDRREEDYQIIKKSDIDEERSVARRSEPRDEEYFYEKKVRERIPDDRAERRLTRREVSPGDSISQVGARRGRNRGYESDDSMVYVRKEKITEGYSDDESPHRRRDIAAGLIAGVGAAELVRRHNEKEGKQVSHGAGRVAKSVGAGVVGAVAAEGIRRYRSKSRRRGSRSRSRSRSGSGDRYGRRRGRDRSRERSRSNSNSNLKNLGGIGLAAAAVAAGALIASKRKKDASPDDRRSRSRTRRNSQSRVRGSSRASSRASLENDPNATDDRNPSIRNKKTAAAGALGAAAMAIYERHRSKSRGRASSESPNRIKQGLPIAGAGLAAAGLAHLYERRKAKEEADVVLEEEGRRSRSRASRSRSRARTESTYNDGATRSTYNDPNLISYGTEPLHGNNFGEGYYGRPGVEQDYYNNSTRDIVPAPVPQAPPAASYDTSSRRPRSTSRTRSLSADENRTRSRSRGAAAAAAAVGAGVAASQYDKRRKEKKERKRRSRDRERDGSREDSYQPYTPGRDPYEDANYHATQTPSYAEGMHDPYAAQSGFYPQAGQFPPPPGSMPQQGAYAPQVPPPGQATYGPQDFPPPPAGVPQAQHQYPDPFAPNQNPYAPRGRGDENV